jgi:hypothetical protein
LIAPCRRRALIIVSGPCRRLRACCMPATTGTASHRCCPARGRSEDESANVFPAHVCRLAISASTPSALYLEYNTDRNVRAVPRALIDQVPAAPVRLTNARVYFLARSMRRPNPCCMRTTTGNMQPSSCPRGLFDTRTTDRIPLGFTSSSFHLLPTSGSAPSLSYWRYNRRPLRWRPQAARPSSHPPTKSASPPRVLYSGTIRTA